ncbi:MAG: DUF2129 domain-containing protein [Pyrinomonadaceae bacterium]
MKFSSVIKLPPPLANPSESDYDQHLVYIYHAQNLRNLSNSGDNNYVSKRMQYGERFRGRHSQSQN